jgi:hypothetical protein
MATKEKFKGSKAHQRYKLASGKIVPGTTTITGLLDKSGPLMYWAWDLGRQGIDYRKYRDKSAEAGTLGHEMIQEYLGGPKVDFSGYAKDIIDKAENVFFSFLEFEKGKTWRTISIEDNLVSEKYEFGGAIDWYGEIDGQKVLMDIKTSKGIYDSHFIQVSAYYKLMVENEMPVSDVLILNVGRGEDEDYTAKYLTVDQLNDGWLIFYHLRQVYDLKKRFK